ncbi:hypothetical protein [Larkinella rosea]|uniref:Uncharacterized protein n=1 Tax=Larkinella rosea TaxID=2025312 RepID=A0A3P1C1M5_9BACT|nr:hypothetical protein [Larkinella rosea]RRB07006.1 hypothetical protein EHT25_04270 [Larkinella rosea]
MKTIFQLLILAIIGPARSQELAYYDSAKSTTSGFWEVLTDYRTSSTEIRYYTPDQKLIHQEVFPHQLVKLTKRNVERLNATLVKVNLQQKEASNVKTVVLPLDHEDSRLTRTRRKRMEEQRRLSPEGMSARVVPSTDGENAMLKIYVYNPHEERLRIDILTAKNNTICQEYNDSFQQYYRFNLSNMPSGTYRVRIYNAKDKVPAVDNLVLLSRQPSQTVFSVQTERTVTPSDDSRASDNQ